MRKVRVTRDYINCLKNKIERLEKENRSLKEDRQKFREEFLYLLRQNVEMVSKNQYYSASTMIHRLSKLMNNVESWYWS